LPSYGSRCLDSFPPVCQAVEKSFSRDVAAGLPRHISNDFSDQWRHKAAAATLFNSLLNRRCRLKASRIYAREEVENFRDKKTRLSLIQRKL
jgi:hypothetical protein